MFTGMKVWAILTATISVLELVLDPATYAIKTTT